MLPTSKRGIMRQKKQINLRLDPATCDLIAELAKGKYVNAFIKELVEQEAARRRGEIIDIALLPVLREVIQQEFLRVISQLHTDLREELRDQQGNLRDELRREEAAIIAEMKFRERRSDDRLAGLIIRAIREGGISRRMLFTYLAKDDSQFAMEVYEDAKAKVGKDIATRFNELPLVQLPETGCVRQKTLLK